MINDENGISRRALLAAAPAALAATGARARERRRPLSMPFASDFLWGVATSAHQTEGNNMGSDAWLLEQTTPTVFFEPSGDACNSFEMWASDLDLVQSLGLNSYRFSLEWARIEPEPGQFSLAMLDHYRRVLEGCHERGLTPVVTFCHFTVPAWFAARNGWLAPDAPMLFARFCGRAARHLAEGLRFVVTLNEPNIEHLLKWANLPVERQAVRRPMRIEAARRSGSKDFFSFFSVLHGELASFQEGLIACHQGARAAIRTACPHARIGVSLAVSDDQAVGNSSGRDRKRREVYGAWLAVAADDDFIGVQNYDRSLVTPNGQIPAPDGLAKNQMGTEIYPASLGNAVRYVHAASGQPVLVTEHGIATLDDAVRSRFLLAALQGLKFAADDGVPVLGYMHWSLFDNFEWFAGYRPRFGLVAVDRASFARTPKPSAHLLGAIAKANLQGVSAG